MIAKTENIHTSHNAGYNIHTLHVHIQCCHYSGICMLTLLAWWSKFILVLLFFLFFCSLFYCFCFSLHRFISFFGVFFVILFVVRFCLSCQFRFMHTKNTDIHSYSHIQIHWIEININPTWFSQYLLFGAPPHSHLCIHSTQQNVYVCLRSLRLPLRSSSILLFFPFPTIYK